MVLWSEVRLATEDKKSVLVQRLSHLRRYRLARQTAAQADPGDLGAKARKWRHAKGGRSPHRKTRAAEGCCGVRASRSGAVAR